MKTGIKKIMVIDDDVPILMSMRSFPWKKYHCQYIGDATDGKEALSLLDAFRPDIIFLDIVMPKMKGLEFLKIAKKKRPNTLFIIHSAYSDFEYAREAIRTGAYDYISKGEMTDEEFGDYLIKIIGKEHFKVSNKNEESYRYEVQFIIDETNNRFMEGISLEILASELGLSPNYLGYIFFKETGKHFKDYLNSIRMERAYTLLKNTPLKVFEVSEQIGFKNTQYFVTAFSKYFGITPGQLK